MARKMTASELKTACATYAAEAKQGAASSSAMISPESVCGMITKIGAQVTLEGGYEDKLPELDSFNLDLGTTVEEYFADLILPNAFTQSTSTTAEGSYSPAYGNIPYETPAYNFSLGKQRFVVTKPMNNFERACIDATVLGNLLSDDLVKLQQSKDIFKYGVKKQLLGNAITKANALGKVIEVQNVTDADKGEAWIETIKNAVEDASFAHDETIASGVTAFIGAAPSMTLYIKKGVMSALQVKTLAGAFNKDELGLGVKVKVVDDFGNVNIGEAVGNYVGILVDDRAIRLHPHNSSVRVEPQYGNDQVTTYGFEEYTGFISKFCYMRAIKIKA